MGRAAGLFEFDKIDRTTLLGLVNILLAVLLLVGILNAVNGKAEELPVIGKLGILK